MISCNVVTLSWNLSDKSNFSFQLLVYINLTNNFNVTYTLLHMDVDLDYKNIINIDWAQKMLLRKMYGYHFFPYVVYNNISV